MHPVDVVTTCTKHGMYSKLRLRFEESHVDIAFSICNKHELKILGPENKSHFSRRLFLLQPNFMVIVIIYDDLILGPEYQSHFLKELISLQPNKLLPAGQS